MEEEDEIEVYKFRTKQRAHNINLLIDGRFSDFLIRCKGREFKVHRAIIVGRSAFFDALIQGSFKEAVQGIAELPEEDEDVMAVVIWFMYTGFAPLPRCNKDGNHAACAEFASFVASTLTQFSLPVRAARAADKLLLPELYRLVTNTLTHNIQQGLSEGLGDAKDLRIAVAMLFDPTQTLDRLAEQVSWSIASEVATYNGDFALLEELEDTIPRFARSLSEEHHHSTCDCCHERIDFDIERLCFILHFPNADNGVRGGKLMWWCCTCQLRGFCASICECSDIEYSSILKYCGACKESTSIAEYRCNVKFNESTERLSPQEVVKCAKFVTEEGSWLEC